MVLPQWVFPVNNSRTDSTATQKFGPAHFGDLFVLEWKPASAAPVILLFCQNSAGNGFDFRKIDTSTSPSLYVLNYDSTASSIACSFAMNDTNGDGSNFGGTNPFTYIPTRGATVATFSSSATSSSTSSSTSRPTSLASSTTSAITTTTAQSSPIILSSTTAQSPSSTPQNDGLSMGAKAGIGVGVVFGTILLAAIAFLALSVLKSKSKRQRKPSAELDGDTEHKYNATTYQGGSGLNELPVYQELPLNVSRQELPA